MRPTKFTACAAAAAAVVAVGASIEATPAYAGTHAPKASTVRLAQGVTFSRTNFTVGKGKKTREQAVTLSVTLSPHTSLVAAYPGNKVSAGRATLRTLARQEHAVAGVSGNVFITKDPHAAGDGGVSHLGSIVKSELKGKDASLWVDSAGHAHVGDPGFTGHLTTGHGRHNVHVSSVNYIDNARKGAVTLLDYHMGASALPSCFMATFVPLGRNQYRVVSVSRHATHFSGLKGSARALVSCGQHQTPWLTRVLTRGETLSGSWGYARSVVTLISGTNHIVRGGRAYHDPHGIPASIDWFQKKRVPEDFACVMRDNRQVLLGSVVGWQSYSPGVTYAELSAYLVKRGCREAIALNGLHESTLVARLPGKGLAVQNRRSNKGERPLVSGLLVTTQ